MDATLRSGVGHGVLAAGTSRDGRAGAVAGASGLGPGSFGDVYAEHFDFVWRSLRRLGVHEADVNDVLQDVFEHAYRRASEFEGRASVRTWLFAIARNLVRNYRRAAPRRRPHEEPHESLADPRAITPLESAERAERARLLNALLAGLDDEKREAFILVDIEEFTAADAACALGVNANTVASRVRAARREIEQALARQRAEERWRAR